MLDAIVLAWVDGAGKVGQCVVKGASERQIIVTAHFEKNNQMVHSDVEEPLDAYFGRKLFCAKMFQLDRSFFLTVKSVQ